MQLESEPLRKFKIAYLVLTMVIGALGVIIGILTGNRTIGYIIIALAAMVMLGGAIIYSQLYKNQKIKDID